MEKYDGHRAIWRPDLEVFVSRQGTRSKPPPSWLPLLPSDLILDGEIWAGRGQFQETTRLVKAGDDASWARLEYIVYDAPRVPGPFVERIEYARARLLAGAATQGRLIDVAETWPCEDSETKDALLQQVLEKGGEGLMLRRASSMFRAGVSAGRDLLKVKLYADAEAVIIRKQFDNGKNSVRIRVLNGEAAGKELNVTVTDTSTKMPGRLVTIKYQHGLEDGMPRHCFIDRMHEYACDCPACEGWRQEKERIMGRSGA